jgi:hypothetical protein
MQQKTVERRTVLKGGAAAFGMMGSGVSATIVGGVEHASARAAQSPHRDGHPAFFTRPFRPISIRITSRRPSCRFS